MIVTRASSVPLAAPLLAFPSGLVLVLLLLPVRLAGFLLLNLCAALSKQ